MSGPAWLGRLQVVRVTEEPRLDPLQEQPEGLPEPKRQRTVKSQQQSQQQSKPQQQRPRRRREAALAAKASQASGRGPSKRLQQRQADTGERQVAAPSHAGVPTAAATQGAAAGSAQAVASAGSQVAHAAGKQAAGCWVRHRDANYYVCKHLQAGDYWWRSEQESCTGRKLREVRPLHSAASCCAPWLGLLTCLNGLPYAVCLDLCCCGWASELSTSCAASGCLLGLFLSSCHFPDCSVALC